MSEWHEPAPAARDDRIGVWRGFGLVLVGLGLVVSLPILLPAVALLDWRERRLMRGAARRTACTRCSAILGLEAIRRADDLWAARLRDWRTEHPHALPRIVRHLHAVCKACDAAYDYDPKQRAFSSLPDGGDAGISPFEGIRV